MVVENDEKRVGYVVFRGPSRERGRVKRVPLNSL